jgi:hypothetical protein
MLVMLVLRSNFSITKSDPPIIIKFVNQNKYIWYDRRIEINVKLVEGLLY